MKATITRKLFFLALLLSMQAVVNAESALQWDHQQLEFHPAVTEKTVTAEFGFTNTSKQPVTVDSVRSSCGCTTTALEKKTYQPGEKGHVSAVFTIGSRRGLQVKAISVDVHGDSQATILTMVTHIGEPVKVEPEFVFWRAGDPPAQKVMKLIVPSNGHFVLNKVTSSSPKMLTEVQTDKDGGGYKIVVTPNGTANPVMAVLTIVMALPSGEEKVLRAYAQVKGSSVQAPAQ